MIDTPMLFVKMSESFNTGDDASQWNIREKVIDCFVFVIYHLDVGVKVFYLFFNSYISNSVYQVSI